MFVVPRFEREFESSIP